MNSIIDTAINGQKPFEGKAYFFKGNQYVRYDWDSEQVDSGFPMNLTEWNFPGAFLDGVDAALNGVGQFAGKAYFFKGDQYVRYDWSTGKVDEGFPSSLSAWNLPSHFLSGIDAAMNGYGRTFDGKAYFFKGQEYVRYDWGTGQIDLQNVLLPAWNLPAPCSWRVDAALEGQGRYAGKAYFFRHNIYDRYDWLSQSGESGYPAHIDFWKLPERFLYFSGKIRDHVWFVIIEPRDYFQIGNEGFYATLNGVIRVADQVGVQVDPIWMPNLRDEFLEDDTLLALFGAGSYADWFTADGDPNWSRYLDSYCLQIRNTHVPIFAVCGTHQLIGRAFADWRAVGHMAPAGLPIPTIADEFAQHSDLTPRPRLGEVGTFPLRTCAGQEMDPLLAGLPNNPQFVEHHHDQINPGGHPSFQAVLEPDPNREPLLTQPNDQSHMNPSNINDRCQVQALRLKATDRVLYITQFHPEVPTSKPEVLKSSDQLIKNFFGIARGFWANR